MPQNKGRFVSRIENRPEPEDNVSDRTTEGTEDRTKCSVVRCEKKSSEDGAEGIEHRRESVDPVPLHGHEVLAERIAEDKQKVCEERNAPELNVERERITLEIRKVRSDCWKENSGNKGNKTKCQRSSSRDTGQEIGHLTGFAFRFVTREQGNQRDRKTGHDGDLKQKVAWTERRDVDIHDRKAGEGLCQKTIAQKTHDRGRKLGDREDKGSAEETMLRK